MSVTWFMIKSLFITFVIVSVLQLRIGSQNKTLEAHFTNWMKNLSASKRIQNIAQGGQQLTTDVIKEFTTEDGTQITITKTEVKRKISNEKKRIKDSLFKDNEVVSRFVNGFKLELNDLTDEAKDSLKSEVKKEILGKTKSLDSKAETSVHEG